MDEALKDLWTAVKDVGYNPAAAICGHWTEHWKDLGSPVGPGHQMPDGSVYQAFTRAILRWTPGGAVESL